jgi:thiamine biosynthesis protein ThiS
MSDPQLTSDSDLAIEVTINGESTRISAGLTVRQMLVHSGVDPQRVAVELNRRIVRKPDWDATLVEAGANIEIVEFVGGG